MTTDSKKMLGQKIATFLENNQTIGVGTGTTVDAGLSLIADRIQAEELDIKIVPTSYQTAWQCQAFGLTVLPFDYGGKIDWGFDGADEVDKQKRAIKGRGGALRQEKVVAKRCQEYFIIVGSEKVTDEIGQLSAVPVECLATEREAVESHLMSLSANKIELRIAQFIGRSGPYFTDQGNIIFDVRFREVSDELEKSINNHPAVVDNGIFTSYATKILVADSDEIKEL